MTGIIGWNIYVELLVFVVLPLILLKLQTILRRHLQAKEDAFGTTEEYRMTETLIGAILGATIMGIIARPFFYAWYWGACARSYDRKHKPPCFCGNRRPSNNEHLYGCPMENYTNPFHGRKWNSRG